LNRVGTGLTNPQERLEVQGNIVANGEIGATVFRSPNAVFTNRIDCAILVASQNIFGEQMFSTNDIRLGTFNKTVASSSVTRLKLRVNNQTGNIYHNTGSSNGVALNFITNNDQGREISNDFLLVIPEGYQYNSPSYAILLQTQRAVSGDFFSQLWLYRDKFQLVRKRSEPVVNDVIFEVNTTNAVLDMYGSISCIGNIYGNSISTPGLNLNTNGAIVFGSGGCGQMWCGDTNHGTFIHQHTSTPTNGNPSDEMEIKSYGRVTIRVCGSGGLFLIPGSTSWSSLSDRRVKDNVKTIEDGYETINKMRPVEYNYNNDLNRKSFGFIAQEILEIKPYLESISYTDDDKFIPFLDDDKKVLSYENEFIIPNLVSAIKTLIRKVEMLEEKIKMLE